MLAAQQRPLALKMKLVTAAIIIKNNKFFIAKRKAGQKLEGFWEFPGGKIEVNETPQQCIERELYEEFKVRAKSGNIIAESIHEYPDGVIKLIGIEAILLSNNIKLTVHDDVKWVDFDEIANINLLPADISLAAQLKKVISCD